jgi:hypothetical protein
MQALQRGKKFTDRGLDVTQRVLEGRQIKRSLEASLKLRKQKQY